MKRLAKTYFFTGFIAISVTFLLFFAQNSVQGVEGINLKGRDLFFRLRHAWFPPASTADSIVLVNLDDETLRRLEVHWPYPRSVYAEALERLKPYQPKAVGFDLIFSGSDFSPEGDQRLMQALEESGNVVIASHQSEAGEIGPLSSIRKHAWEVGIVAKPRDPDHVIRRSYFSFLVDGHPANSWELALFRKSFPEAHIQNLSPGSDFVVDYRFAFDEFEGIPFWRLLEGSVLAKTIQSKIILVGLTAEAFHDIHVSPLGLMPGLGINANVLFMLIEGQFFSSVPAWLEFVLTFLSLWLVLLIAVSNPFGVACLLAAFLALVYLASSFFLFLRYVILDLWLVVLTAVLILIAHFIFRELWLLIESLRLRSQQSPDPVTGFYGRKFFDIKLKVEFARTVQKRSWFGRRAPELSILIFDFDRFETFEEMLGSKERIEQLRLMSAAIRSVVRKNELVCHYAENQFAVILPNTPLSQAVSLAEKIRKFVATSPDFVSRKADRTAGHRLSTSLGVASTAHGSVTDPKKLLKAALRAFSQAKLEGDRVCV